MSFLNYFFEDPGCKCTVSRKEAIIGHLKKNKLAIYYSLALMAFATIYGLVFRYYFRKVK